MRIPLILLLIVVPLKAAELTFEVVDVTKSRSSREQQLEIFMDAYDAFAAVIRDGGFEWVDAFGRHKVKLENARLVADCEEKTLRVVIPRELDSVGISTVSDALFVAVTQKQGKRIAEAVERLQVKIGELKEALGTEKDVTRRKILAQLLNAAMPLTGLSPEEEARRTRLRLKEANTEPSASP